MNVYSKNRNTVLAAVLVAMLAGLVSNGLALGPRVLYERDVSAPSAPTVLPEVVVVAKRLES